MSFNRFYISEKDGIPLFFQHGLTASSDQIKELLGNLEGIRLFSMDCPGHGHSILGKNYHPSFDQYATEVIQFMDHMDIDCAVVGGLSMGSGIALNMALRFPNRVKAIIVHRPAWLDEIHPDNLLLLLKASEFISKPGGKEEFTHSKEMVRMRSNLPAVANSIMGIFSATQQEQLPLVIRKMVGDSPFRSIETLKRINKPCLIIGNEDDPLHPFEMAVKIHKQIRYSVMEKVTSRYLDPVVHKDQVRKLILNFIQNLAIQI